LFAFSFVAGDKNTVARSTMVVTTTNSGNAALYSTYEATKAAESISHQPDPIHWQRDSSFRDSQYRQLHHQRGVCGIFSCRLLEANDLQRMYWSALAIGPVRHLGLSKAHGPVSSFCSFSLGFRDDHPHIVMAAASSLSSSAGKKMPLSVAMAAAKLQQKTGGGGAAAGSSSSYDGDRKPAARTHSVRKNNNSAERKPSVVSPVIANHNNPVWDNFHFEFPLKKGACRDGQRVFLEVRVDEEGTAVESFLPANRLLGIGAIDLTDLCLGETSTGQPLPGVRDAWIDIYTGQDEQSDEDPLLLPPHMKRWTGRVHVLLSYGSFGIDPQPRDIIALESFARRDPVKSTCRPVLDPLGPLVVLDRRGVYVLAEYVLRDSRKATVRLHRNTIFVIERQNWVDAAHNIALLPIDVALATPLGRGAQQALAPVVTAGRELMMPALLTVKLLWMAARTTGLGVVSGVQALGSTVWHEGSSSLTNRDRETTHRSATAQFVQL
jgi:hypothetical protein